MRAASKPWRTVGRAARWVARVVGSLLVALYVVFAIGEGPPPLSWPTGFLCIALLGYVVAWFGDLAAAGLILAGVAAFYLNNFGMYGRFPGGPVFPLMYVPGVLLIAAFLLDRRRRARRAS